MERKAGERPKIVLFCSERAVENAEGGRLVLLIRPNIHASTMGQTRDVKEALSRDPKHMKVQKASKRSFSTAQRVLVNNFLCPIENHASRPSTMKWFATHCVSREGVQRGLCKVAAVIFRVFAALCTKSNGSQASTGAFAPTTLLWHCSWCPTPIVFFFFLSGSLVVSGPRL